MKYLLDTDTCVYIIKKRPESVFKKVSALNADDVGISSITFAELVYGAEKSNYRDLNLLKLTEFAAPFRIVPFDSRAAAAYGSLRAGLESTGKPIGGMDLLIAAHAVAEEVTLVSNNTREFRRVKGLRLENWV